MKRWIVLLVVLLLALPAMAQVSEPVEPERTAGEAESTRPRDAGAVERIRDRIRQAARLPEAAGEAREAGIPEEEVEKVITEARRRRIPPRDVETVLVESAASARENGPVDNFGAFVQSQLDQGLRGRELAEAIHREHAARGKGPMKARVKGKGKGKGQVKDRGERMDREPGRVEELGEEKERKAADVRTKGRDGGKGKNR